MTSPCSAMWDPIAFDLTVCGRHLILDTALPSLLLVISLIYLANYYLSNIDHFKSPSFKGAIRIPDGEEECLIRADDSLVIEDAFITMEQRMQKPLPLILEIISRDNTLISMH